MSITFHIWETLSVVFFPLMFTLVSKNFKALMFYTFVVQTSMEQPLKSRLWRRKRLLEKFVIIIIKFILKFINGLTLVLITLVELQLNGTLKYVKTFSWTLEKRTEFNNKRWLSVIVKIAIYSWLTDSFVVLVHSVDMKMPEEINVINVKNFTIIQLKWKIIIVLSVNQLLSWRTQFTSLLTYQWFKKTCKNGLMNPVKRVNGHKTQSPQLKPGQTWVWSQNVLPEI